MVNLDVITKHMVERSKLNLLDSNTISSISPIIVKRENVLEQLKRE